MMSVHAVAGGCQVILHYRTKGWDATALILKKRGLNSEWSTSCRVSYRLVRKRFSIFLFMKMLVLIFF